MSKRIIINMDVDYWNPMVRKGIMQYLIHNCKVVSVDEDWNECTEFKGVIIEPANPPPLIPIQKPDDKVYEIKWS